MVTIILPLNDIVLCSWGQQPRSGPTQQQPFAWLRLAAAIRSNVDRIAAAEQEANQQMPSATRHQCDQAVRFIAHYAEQDYRWRAPRAVGADGGTAQLVIVDATARRSLFEVFTSIAVHLQVNQFLSNKSSSLQSISLIRSATVLGSASTLVASISAIQSSIPTTALNSCQRLMRLRQTTLPQQVPRKSCSIPEM